MDRLSGYGAAVLRITLGVVFLAHSVYLKVFVFTVGGTVGYFESIGLPGFTAYLVLLAETVGGVLLVTGVRVREAASVLAVIAFGATWAHAGAGWLFSNPGGGWEYPLFLALASVAQALLGPGALRAARRAGGSWPGRKPDPRPFVRPRRRRWRSGDQSSGRVTTGT